MEKVTNNTQLVTSVTAIYRIFTELENKCFLTLKMQ